MKIRVVLLSLVFMVLLSLVGCHKCGNEVSRIAVDCQYIESHYTTYYTYIHSGKMTIPISHLRFHPDKWELKYLVTYEDGCKKEKWCEVSEEEYNTFKESEQK